MRNLYSFICSSYSTYRQLLCWTTLFLVGLFPSLVQAQSGTVFRDFNGNGSPDNSATFTEPGVLGVVVTAYGTGGPKSVTTTSTGSFTITGMSGTVRLEFTNLKAGDFDGVRVGNSATNVQFVTASTTGILYGINYPSDFCQSNPDLATPCYVNVNPTSLASGSAADLDAFVSLPYSSTGRDADTNIFSGSVVQSPTMPDHDVTVSKIGAVWGIAYQRESKFMLAATVVKRHAGLTAQGLNALYKIDYSSPSSSTPTVSLFVSVSTIGINVGSLADRTSNLPIALADPSTDPVAYTAVGKYGMGDIDLSDDGTYLYITNLFDRRIYRVFINNPAVIPTAANVTSWNPAATITGCTGTIRPWALKVYHNRVYVGMVCDGAGGTAANLRAYLYSFDLDGGNPRREYDFPLNYPRGEIISGVSANWLPWDDRLATDPNTGSAFNAPGDYNFPQPLVSDLEFDVDGSMIVGLMDRTGHVLGHRNAIPTTINQLVNGSAGGDLLRIYLTNPSDPTSWTLESAGQVRNSSTGSLLTSAGATNLQGPGNGEFYFSDCVGCDGSGNNGFHDETFVGGLALLPGKGQVVASVYDPINLDSGGLTWFSNTTGAKTQAYQLYFGASTEEPQFGKVNGVGDIELLCDAAPIMIGNRVWSDLNNDGVQDPSEPALAGVVVQLKGLGVPANTTAVTNSTGEYYFTNAVGTNTVGFVYSLTGLTSGASYSLCFPTRFSTLSLSKKPNSATGSNADAIDTDANGSGVISFTLGRSGQNNYTYDAAFTTEPCLVSLTATPGSCQSATNSYVLTGAINFSNTPGGLLTITDDGANTNALSTTVSVPANASAVSFTLSGISSGGRSHTVTASFSNTACGPQSMTYISPISCTVAPCTGTNLLQNSSFEQGMPVPSTGQLTQSPPPSWVGGSADNNPNALFTAPDGYAFAYSSDNGGTLCQVVSATPGEIYTLTFFAGVHQANGQTVTLSFLNSSSAVVGTPAVFTVTHVLESNNTFGGPYSLSGVAPGGATQVRVCAVSGNGTGANFRSKIDNLCLTGIAAPCSLSITTTALASGTTGTAYNQSVGSTGGTAPLTFSVVGGTLPAGLLLDASTGLISGTPTSAGTGSFTVNVTDGKSCSDTQPLTFTIVAPPVCGVSLTVTPGLCQTANNTYTLTGRVATTNMPSSGTLTVSSAAFSPAFTQPLPTGNSSGTFNFSGLVSNGQTFSVTALFSNTACAPVTQTFAAPASCSIAPVCSLTITPTVGVCNTATNTYSSTVVVQISTTGAGGVLTVTDGAISQTLVVGAGLSSFTGTAIVNGSLSDGSSHTVTASLPGCSSMSATYTAPASCSVAPPSPSLKLDKKVSARRARLGQVISYTVTLANTGPVAATSIIVSDTYTAGLSLVPGSISVTAGSYTPSIEGGTWAVASLPINATATLTYAVSVLAEGILYNTARRPGNPDQPDDPGEEVQVCTSVPFAVCKGVPFALELSAPTGHDRYQWYYTAPGSSSGTVVSDGTLNTFTATLAGEYTIVINNGIVDRCVEAACCPILIEETDVPSYTAVTRNPTCTGTIPQANGQITLMDLGPDPTQYSYQVSPGSLFSAASATPAASIPASGIISSALTQGTYTVRVWVKINGALSCPRDLTVTLTANCACPEAICVPVVVRKTSVSGR